MKRDRLLTGMLLLGIGILFLLDNFKVINFHWGNIVSLWPLFLIIPGINMVFSYQNSRSATMVKILVAVAVFALFFYRGMMPNDNQFWKHKLPYVVLDDNNNDGDDKTVFNKVESNSVYNAPYSDLIKSATLNITGGGATYNLRDTTASLFNADTHLHSGRFIFSTEQTGSGKTIYFHTKNTGRSFNWDGDDNDEKGNVANIKLNPNPIWNINIGAGASKLDFDFSKFKVKNLDIKGGAASMDLKLGQPIAGNTMVDVSTGVSEVNISVPASAACHITSKTGLSSKTFDGFASKGDNQYETAGFNNAPNKIYISLKGGVSDFKVSRY